MDLSFLSRQNKEDTGKENRRYGKKDGSFLLLKITKKQGERIQEMKL